MVNPTRYTVELRNKNFELIKILTKFVRGLSWEYVRIGGCGRCSMNLAMLLDTLENVSADCDIQIRLENSSGGTDLAYRGYIETDKPILSKQDKIQLQTFGYVGQLKRVRVNKTYNNQEISVIVKDILDTFVIPNTSIIYDTSDIEGTQFVVDTIEFDEMADSALRILAELAGSIEWGVDRNRKFFFKTKSDATRHYLRLKKEITNYDTINDYGSIVNRLIIKGGMLNGSQFVDTINNDESQTSYGLRTQIISNSAIVTSSVSQQYGTMVLAEKAKIQRRITVKVTKNTKFFEDTIPLGRLSLLGETVYQAKQYGDDDAIYGTFKYGGQASLQINKIQYKITDERTEVNINGGASRPDISEQIKKLEFEINQLRNV